MYSRPPSSIFCYNGLVSVMRLNQLGIERPNTELKWSILWWQRWRWKRNFEGGGKNPILGLNRQTFEPFFHIWLVVQRMQLLCCKINTRGHYHYGCLASLTKLSSFNGSTFSNIHASQRISTAPTSSVARVKGLSHSNGSRHNPVHLLGGKKNKTSCC